MSPFGLAAVAWVLFAGLLLFGLLVVVRFTIALVRDAKDLKNVAGVSSRRLREAVEASGVQSMRTRQTVRESTRQADEAGRWRR